MRQSTYAIGSSRYRIYTFILAYQEKEYHAPSVREICIGTELRSTSTVHAHINRMIRDGLLSRWDGHPRTLRANPGAWPGERGEIRGTGDTAL